MSLQTQISKRIKTLYEFHGEAITKSNLIELTELFVKMKSNITEDQISEFFYLAETGEYGMFHRYPTWLTTSYRKFITELKQRSHYKPL